MMFCHTEAEEQLAAPPAEDEEPKSEAQVLVEVLDRRTKKNMFLPNLGIQVPTHPRLSARDAAAQLEAEKMENVELPSVISNRSKQIEELQLARTSDKEETNMKIADLEAKLELLLGGN
nr:unnamed protein product [Digitaria exilis]